MKTVIWITALAVSSFLFLFSFVYQNRPLAFIGSIIFLIGSCILRGRKGFLITPGGEESHKRGFPKYMHFIALLMIPVGIFIGYNSRENLSLINRYCFTIILPVIVYALGLLIYWIREGADKEA